MSLKRYNKKQPNFNVNISTLFKLRNSRNWNYDLILEFKTLPIYLFEKIETCQSNNHVGGDTCKRSLLVGQT